MIFFLIIIADYLRNIFFQILIIILLLFGLSRPFIILFIIKIILTLTSKVRTIEVEFFFDYSISIFYQKNPQS